MLTSSKESFDWDLNVMKIEEFYKLTTRERLRSQTINNNLFLSRVFQEKEVKSDARLVRIYNKYFIKRSKKLTLKSK